MKQTLLQCVLLFNEYCRYFGGSGGVCSDVSRTSTESSSRGSCIRAPHRTPPKRPEAQTAIEIVRDPTYPCVSSSRPAFRVGARAFEHFQRQKYGLGHQSMATQQCGM